MIKWIALLIGGYYILPKLLGGADAANAAKNSMFDIKGIEWQGISGLKLKLNVIIQAANPTESQLTIQHVLLDIKVNGDTLATIRETNANKLIQANETTTFKIALSVGFKEIGSALLAILTSGSIPKQATVTGTIKANGIPVDINELVDIKK